MTETLALLKQLRDHENIIQEHIDELTLEKIAIQKSINDLISLPINLHPRNKSNPRYGNRAPSGFMKPVPIYDELADFLGIDNNTLISRTDVTRRINKYIREHGLQDINNHRKINPDAKLKALFKLNDTDELTYFNLQKYISPFFVPRNN